MHMEGGGESESSLQTATSLMFTVHATTGLELLTRPQKFQPQSSIVFLETGCHAFESIFSTKLS